MPTESARCSKCKRKTEPERFRVTAYGNVFCNRCDPKELKRKERQERRLARVNRGEPETEEDETETEENEPVVELS